MVIVEINSVTSSGINKTITDDRDKSQKAKVRADWWGKYWVSGTGWGNEMLDWKTKEEGGRAGEIVQSVIESQEAIVWETGAGAVGESGGGKVIT